VQDSEPLVSSEREANDTLAGKHRAMLQLGVEPAPTDSAICPPGGLARDFGPARPAR